MWRKPHTHKLSRATTPTVNTVPRKLKRHLETWDPSERNFAYCKVLAPTQTDQEGLLDCEEVSDKDTHVSYKLMELKSQPKLITHNSINAVFCRYELVCMLVQCMFAAFASP